MAVFVFGDTVHLEHCIFRSPDLRAPLNGRLGALMYPKRPLILHSCTEYYQLIDESWRKVRGAIRLSMGPRMDQSYYTPQCRRQRRKSCCQLLPRKVVSTLHLLIGGFYGFFRYSIKSYIPASVVGASLCLSLTLSSSIPLRVASFHTILTSRGKGQTLHNGGRNRRGYCTGLDCHCHRPRWHIHRRLGFR